jgi:hypothetical protein
LRKSAFFLAFLIYMGIVIDSSFKATYGYAERNDSSEDELEPVFLQIGARKTQEVERLG